MNIREELKKKCNQNGKTFSDVARIMGITPQQMNQFLNGSPKLSFLEKFADALNISVSELLRTTEENPDQIQGEKFGIICPYCGEFIQLSASIQDTTENGDIK